MLTRSPSFAARARLPTPAQVADAPPLDGWWREASTLFPDNVSAAATDGPDYKLHITPSNMENLNLPDNLEKIKQKIFDNLKGIVAAPNVQMHQTAPDAGADDDGADDDADPDSRGGQGGADKKVDPTATV